jgi:A/G-specific adenine glycosylase
MSVAGFPPRPSEAARARFRSSLLAWYRAERRDLPWRRTRDPWSILVSEAMLQQTRVEAVRDAYERFLARFPTPARLANASEDEALAAWSGLGYYRRARALQAAARAIVAHGDEGFPRTRGEMVALPGVGPYTAGAVLSIAFDLREAVVDGNVERVFARYFGLDAEAGSRELTRECWALAELCLPPSGAGDWNQALMELGATLCVPRSPACPRCPLATSCKARAEERVDELPRRKQRDPPLDVELVILIAEREGRWLLERRPSSGRMAGMWQLPTLECPREDGRTLLFPERFPAAGPRVVAGAAPLGELRHTITRHRIRARLVRARAPGTLPDPPFRWCNAEEIAALALTGMAKKAWRQLARGR